MSEWEKVGIQSTDDEESGASYNTITERMNVPGGWLYARSDIILAGGGETHVNMVFVADEDSWKCQSRHPNKDVPCERKHDHGGKHEWVGHQWP